MVRDAIQEIERHIDYVQEVSRDPIFTNQTGEVSIPSS